MLALVHGLLMNGIDRRRLQAGGVVNRTTSDV